MGPRRYVVRNADAQYRLRMLLQQDPEYVIPLGSYSNVGFSRNHDDPDPGVVAQLFQRLDQPQPQLARQGVHGLGTVEGQGGDGVVCIDQKRGV